MSLRFERAPELIVALALAALAGCAASRVPDHPAPAAPPLLLGAFVDDYGNRYRISATTWTQLPRTRYHIERWDVAGRYLIARNDSGNPSDAGRWTRIDWLELPGMPPWQWAFCYSAYRAPSAAVAETVSVANRATPRSGCNGYPFSRMRALPADSLPPGN